MEKENIGNEKVDKAPPLLKKNESKFKTSVVLSKWVDNIEGNIEKEDLREAASKVASMNKRYEILKWSVLVLVVFVFLLLGLMIASVVIGINITKDVKAKDGMLRDTKNNMLSVKSYMNSYNMSLYTPVKILDGVKSLTLNVDMGGYKSTVKVVVLSYLFIPGRFLTFYGMYHQVTYQQNGEVLIEKINSNKNALLRSNAESSVSTNCIDNCLIESTEEGMIPETTEIFINSCEELVSMGTNGVYKLGKSISCNLSEPLFKNSAFNGTLDGNGFDLFYRINSETEDLALFGKFSGYAVSLKIHGELKTSGKASCFALELIQNDNITMFIDSSGFYCRITLLTEGTQSGCIATSAHTNQNELSKIVLRRDIAQCVFYYDFATSSFGEYSSIGVVDANIDINVMLELSIVNLKSVNGNYTQPKFARAFNREESSLKTLSCKNLMKSSNFHLSQDESPDCIVALNQISLAPYEIASCPPIADTEGLSFEYLCFKDTTSNKRNTKRQSSSADELFGTSTTGGSGVKTIKSNGKVKRMKIIKDENGFEIYILVEEEDLFSD